MERGGNALRGLPWKHFGLGDVFGLAYKWTVRLRMIVAFDGVFDSSSTLLLLVAYL